MSDVKILLDESEIPRQWYNLAADLPTPVQPPLGPDGKPISPDMLAPVFPMNLIEQEMSTERWIDIPMLLHCSVSSSRAYSTEMHRITSRSPRHQNQGCSPNCRHCAQAPQRQGHDSIGNRTVRHRKQATMRTITPIRVEIKE